MRAYAMAQRPSSVRRPSGVNFFLQTTFSQKPLDQFQPNLAENMPGDGDSDCSNKGAGPFWGPI